MAKKNWIPRNLKKGALTRMARAKGMSISEFCGQPKTKLSTVAKRR